MQLKYCPQCGNMDFVSAANGLVCTLCHFGGPMAEGPMDKINEVRKKARSNLQNIPKLIPSTSQSMKELAEKLKSLKGKSSEDAEFL